MTSAWDEPVAHGRYGPWASKSANPYGIRVGALTSVEVRGGDAEGFYKGYM